MGDALGCDLPRRAHETSAAKGEGVECAYVAPPPTPYIAYLRKGMKPGQLVKNHVVQVRVTLLKSGGGLWGKAEGLECACSLDPPLPPL